MVSFSLFGDALTEKLFPSEESSPTPKFVPANRGKSRRATASGSYKSEGAEPLQPNSFLTL